MHLQSTTLKSWERAACSGVLRTQKLRTPLLRTQSSQWVSLWKRGAGQNIVLHASPSARNSASLISVLSLHPRLFVFVFLFLFFFVCLFVFSKSLSVIRCIIMVNQTSTCDLMNGVLILYFLSRDILDYFLANCGKWCTSQSETFLSTAWRDVLINQTFMTTFRRIVSNNVLLNQRHL